MRTRSRNDAEKAKRRELLLDAAQTVFFNKGFEDTSMDDIAAQSGFSRALLYVYFNGKKDIYHYLRIRSLEALYSRVEQLTAKKSSGLDKLKQTGFAYYQFYLRDRKHFDCLSVDMSLSNQCAEEIKEMDQDKELLQVETKLMQIMQSAIETGIQDGSIDPEKVQNPLQSAMFLRGSLHGVIMLTNEDGSALLEQAGLDKQQLVEYTIELGVGSLAPNQP